MIHAGALDFSECHSKEVISFFWRSVYMYVLYAFDFSGYKSIKDIK